MTYRYSFRAAYGHSNLFYIVLIVKPDVFHQKAKLKPYEIDPEDLKHMLFICCRAREVWEELSLGAYVAAIAEQHRSGSLILDEIICSRLPGRVSVEGENAVELAMVTCWYIWWERRQVSHDKEIGTPA